MSSTEISGRRGYRSKRAALTDSTFDDVEPGIVGERGIMYV